MSRLTEKYYAIKTQRCNGKTQQVQMFANVYNKLSQLEDIEDELGIDLITLFKALKYGVYDKFNCFYKPHLEYDDNLKRFLLVEKSQDGRFTSIIFLEDYGKTWSLNKEELIKEN